MEPRTRIFPTFSFVLALLLPLTLGIALTACSDDGDELTPTATPAGAIATPTGRPETTPTPPPAGSASITVSPGVTPSASVTPGSSDAPPLEYLGYEIIGDFVYADPVEFPEDLLMLVETGCNQCDGPTEALYRVWRNAGETHVELLVDATISHAENAYITSFAVTPDLSDIVITVCTDCGGEGRPLVEAAVTVYRSIDGGITWRDVFQTPAGTQYFAQAITPQGIALSDFDGNLFYLRGDAIEPPEGAERLLHTSTRAGELRWLAEDGSTVLDNAGNAIAIVEPGSLVEAVAPDGPDWTQAAVGWGLNRVTGPFGGWVVTRTGPDGKLLGFRSDNSVSPVTVLDNGGVLGGLSSIGLPRGALDGGVIGYIEASKGVLTPIGGALLQIPFGDGSLPTGRNHLQGAISGPFLRVTTQGTTCLPIRVSTDSRSKELTCAADGVLVYDLHNTTTVGGQEWARVRLLDGREGFTVTSFLTTD